MCYISSNSIFFWMLLFSSILVILYSVNSSVVYVTGFHLRRVDPSNADYNHYVKYLRDYTSNISLPFLIDVNVVYIGSELRFHITDSHAHIPGVTVSGPKDIAERDCNYTLIFYDKKYSNALNVGRHPVFGYHQLLFIVPTDVVWRNGSVISLSLIKHLPHREYNNVKAYVRIPRSERLSVVTSTYISNYNSIDELKSFVAYQKLINISKVFLYVATPIPNLEKELMKPIQNGFVELVDYMWPRPNKDVIQQRNNENAQRGFSFYRLKYEADAVIECDADEYVNSEIFPYNVVDVAEYLFKRYPNINVFRVGLRCYALINRCVLTCILI